MRASFPQVPHGVTQSSRADLSQGLILLRHGSLGFLQLGLMHWRKVALKHRQGVLLNA